jgi:DNA primase
MAGAPVSVPLTWDEVEGNPPRCSIRTIWRRLEGVGDLFAPVLTTVQNLRRATAELTSML